MEIRKIRKLEPRFHYKRRASLWEIFSSFSHSWESSIQTFMESLNAHTHTHTHTNLSLHQSPHRKNASLSLSRHRLSFGMEGFSLSLSPSLYLPSLHIVNPIITLVMEPYWATFEEGGSFFERRTFNLLPSSKLFTHPTPLMRSRRA